MEWKEIGLQFPAKAVWEEKTYRKTYGKLVVEPLERGYGITLGNSLRRVLFSSIPGVAVTSVKFDGVPHEFSTLSGIKEDFVDICLNLKQVRLKSKTSNLPQKVRIEIKGEKEVLARDLIDKERAIVLNPFLHIATLEKGASLNLELEISAGFGYVPAERRIEESRTAGIISLDALYSPVTRVNYHVETNVRVGPRVDYERLIMEIWTNGGVEAKEATFISSNILGKFFSFLSEEKASLNIPIPKVGFSTRVSNLLLSKDIKTLDSLLKLSQKDLTSIPNIGEKAVEEIKKVLKKKGQSLKEVQS